MVAEVVPEKRRVEAGALLYTSAPIGVFLATAVTYLVSGVFMKEQPSIAWRYVFLSGLIPAAVVQPVTHTAALLTTIAMAGLGLGVDLRTVVRTGLRVTLAVTVSLLVLGVISYALIRISGISGP